MGEITTQQLDLEYKSGLEQIIPVAMKKFKKR
jgi:hypothetical protein